MSPASNASTAAAVRRVLADILGLPDDGAALHDGANLFDLGLDSLGVVRFLDEIEATLALRIPDEALSADLFERLDRVIACIQAQTAEPAA